MKSKPKKKAPGTRRRRKPETRGRPELPPETRKVALSTRVPVYVLKGLKKRARAHGTDNRGKARSSVALEVERAFVASPICNLPGVVI